ncbi:uncharacterized protein RJT21DRAFT_108396 [Scheffersomyces amazonensis]|uniref:uncharacterized protein n=1 Tax=Scheffersomyces amazonensis TaxID=1078765 RepID=UPI00315D44D3
MTYTVFITGATGYIGGEVLYQLLNNADGLNFEVTALVRTESKAANLIAKTGSRVKAVLGDLDDTELIKKYTEASDIIINTANVDHVPSAEALSEVLVASLKPKILIHTSGTSVLGDGIKAKKPPATKIYSDSNNIGELNSLPLAQPHRPVDAIVLDIHDKNPKIETIVIAPSTIYGISNGYDNLYSIQIPFLISASLKNKQAFTVYDGNYIWSRVHIKDLGDLYYLVLHKLIKKESLPVNREGYYFGSLTIQDAPNSAAPTEIEHTWKEISQTIGKKLYERKLVNSAEIVELQPQAIIELTGDDFAPAYWGTNSRSRGDNGKLIGWKPKYTSKQEFLDSIDDDIDHIIKNLKF